VRILRDGQTVREAEDPEVEFERALDTPSRLRGIVVVPRGDEFQLPVREALDEIGGEEDAWVSLEEEGIVGKLRPRRMDGAQATR
jgi:hypothetical protein